ncbi:MAG: porin [Gammaproteobacteria bacterium]|nr:porin [Gammaproteobacteria bacterium]
MAVLGQISALLTALLLPASVFANSTTLYGDFRYSINNIDDSTGSTLRAENNATRIGLKGHMSEKKGITVFYNFQTGVNVDKNEDGDTFTQRFFFAGIKGDFGKLVYGRTSTPYKMAGLKIDPFYDTSAGLGLGGANYGLSGLTNSWSDNTLAYSKETDSFSFNIGTYLDDTEEDSHDINIGFSYHNDSLNVGIQYLDIGDTGVVAKSTADSSAIRFHAMYTAGMWGFGGSLEFIEPQNSDTQKYIYLSTTYNFSDQFKVSGSYGSVDDVSIAADGDAITLGAFYNLLQKTQIYVLFSAVNAGADRDTFALGVSQKFSHIF